MNINGAPPQKKIAPWLAGMLLCVAGFVFVGRGVLQVVDLRQRGIRTQAVIVATDYVRDSDNDTKIEHTYRFKIASGTFSGKHSPT